MARPGDCSWWRRRASSCRSTCGWLSPPIVPSTAARSPAGVVTSSGERVCGGRRPGVELRGVARLQAEPDAPVVQEDAGAGDHEVAPPVGRVDWMRDTPVPSASVAHRWIVPPGAAGDTGEVRAAGSMAAAARAEPVQVESRARPVGLVVQDRGAVVPGLPGRLHEEVGPGRVVGVVGEGEALGDPGHAGSEVPCEGGGTVQMRWPHASSEMGATQSACKRSRSAWL